MGSNGSLCQMLEQVLCEGLEWAISLQVIPCYSLKNNCQDGKILCQTMVILIGRKNLDG